MQPDAYAINQHPCSASTYYAAACDPSRHIAIEACAGAGKTWILVSRILRALFAGAQPQSILAITFTKKAAGEMQQRLSEWLTEFATADDTQLAIELQARGLATPSPADIARLRGLQAQLWQTPQSVQIRTFHGWFTSLLQSAPLAVFEALELPYPFTLFESDAALIEQVWPAFYAAIAADADLEADYASLIADLGRQNTQDALAAALGKRLEFGLADAAQVIDNSLSPLALAFPQLAAYAQPEAAIAPGTMLHTQLRQHCAELLQGSGKTEQKQAALLQTALEQGDWQACCSALLTATGEPRQALLKHPAGQAAIGIIQELKDWDTHRQALHYQRRMAHLLRVLIAQYQSLKRERGWLDMVDVELAAKKLLTESPLAAWMQERLDAQVRHLLIDEFQDTSPLQWQILKEWLGNYAGAGGGAEMPRLFIVGDPKQSIYRFRNAEPRVFMDAQALVQSLGGALLSCDHTRRNAPPIIDCLNQLLSQVGMAGFRPHTTASLGSGAVLAQCFERPEKSADSDAGWRDSLSTPREAEESPAQAAECEALACWLAKQIQQHGCAPQDFMVLARKRSRLTQLYRHLSAHGLPALLSEKSLLPEHLEVQDLMALLEVLQSPGQDLPLAQVLKSPIFGWSDAQLVALALAAKQAGSNWWQALAASDAADCLALHAQLLRWQEWVRSLPVYDALFAIYHDGELPTRYSQAAPPTLRARISSNLQGLLEAALDFQSGRFANSWQFLRALRNPREQSNFPAPALVHGSAIQLLTVHGAKGLEAEHVILIDTMPQADKAQSYGVLSDWPAQSPQPSSFVFLRTAGSTPPQVQALLATEKALQTREELNALYVAMTRARQRLIFTATASKGSNPQAWWHLLQTHGGASLQTLPNSTSDTASTVPNTTEQPPIAILSLPQLPPAPVNTAPTTTAEAPEPYLSSSSNSLIARRGQALHRLLEWGLSSAPENDAWQERLMRDFALDATVCDELLAQAQVLRSGDGAWVWDANRISWAGNEVDIAHQGQLLRLDRLVCERASGHWWVIDYKTALTPERQTELQAQMHSYIMAVQAAKPEASVRAAWIAGDGRWVEFSPAPTPAPAL